MLEFGLVRICAGGVQQWTSLPRTSVESGPLPRELRSPQRAESAGRSNGGTEVDSGVQGRPGRLAVTEADLINRECEGQAQPTQMSFRAVAAVANIGAPSADRGLSRWRA